MNMNMSFAGTGAAGTGAAGAAAAGEASVVPEWKASGGAAVVAAEQAERRCVVLDPAAGEGYLWQWRPEDDPRIGECYHSAFGNPSEVKPRDNGRLFVTASGGGFASIDMKTGRADFFGTVHWSYNPHSIALLPDGRVALACSQGNCVALADVREHPLDPAGQRQNAAFGLESAHGLVWQPRRARLWALGATDIVGLLYCPDEMAFREQERFNFTGAGCGRWGHDLVGDGDGNLVFTTHETVSRLDPATGAFTVLEQRPNVKSVSFSRQGTLYCIPRQEWWTDTLHVGEREITRAGARFYKARWL